MDCSRHPEESTETAQLRLDSSRADGLREVALGNAVAHIWGTKNHLFYVHITSVGVDEPRNITDSLQAVVSTEGVDPDLATYQGTLSREEALHEAEMIDMRVEMEHMEWDDRSVLASCARQKFSSTPRFSPL